ncbi:MAG: AAA family ATPase [Acidobacteriota bacterium]|nr:AAA family ATPase [Acidobacteriota bacterium]
MLTRIEIKGLRAIRYVNIRLRDFQVFVGPNASGKSTFFDAVALVRDVLLSDVETAVRGNTRLGIPMRAVDPRDLTWKREGKPVEIALTAKIPEKLQNETTPTYRLARYEIGLNLEGTLSLSGENFWLIADDESEIRVLRRMRSTPRSVFPEFHGPSTNVLQPGNKKAPQGWRKVVSKAESGNDYFRSENSKWNNLFRLGPARSALANLPEDEIRFPIATWFKRFLMEGTRVLMLNPEAMRLPTPAGSPTMFLPDGSNLATVVNNMERHAPDRLGQWLDHIQTSLPDIQAIRTRERPEDRSQYIEITYAGGLVAPSWLLSDGTLRMLALTLLAYAEQTAHILLIEEPENGVHPKAVETVFQSLNSIYGGQVFCATHSPLVLSLLDLEHLFCFAKTKEGAVDVVHGPDHPALKNWRAATHLGDLFAMGVLG